MSHQSSALAATVRGGATAHPPRVRHALYGPRRAGASKIAGNNWPQMPSRFARLRAIGCTGTMSTKLLVCSRVAGFTQFDLAAFLPNTDLPNGIVGPPILPVGSLLVGPPIRLSGPVVAFDDPIVVGTYDITLAAVAVPSSAMLLFS